jgi:hypothetical protein
MASLRFQYSSITRLRSFNCSSVSNTVWNASADPTGKQIEASRWEPKLARRTADLRFSAHAHLIRTVREQLGHTPV